MSELTLKGSLEDLLIQSNNVSTLIKQRQADGFQIFLSDEEWQYDTQKDTRVCPTCDNYGVQRVFRGDEIPQLFPYNIATPEPYKYLPRTHQPDLSKFMDAECRCTLTWLNPLSCLEQRLHQLKLEAII